MVVTFWSSNVLVSSAAKKKKKIFLKTHVFCLSRGRRVVELGLATNLMAQ